MCGGEGRAVTPRNVRVKIPAGTVLLQHVPRKSYHSPCKLAANTGHICIWHFSTTHCLIQLCILIAGVDHGSVLRLNGQGDVGTFGGKRGDIILRFVVSLDEYLLVRSCLANIVGAF